MRDRVLGGGWVMGSSVLLGGEPGIGKSTLLLQLACAATADPPPLYATGEIGVFEMRGDGLSEVREPSRLFLGEDAPRQGGATVSLCLGSRSFLVLVQALIAGGDRGQGARKVSGVDGGRVSMILAVLERRCGLALGAQDVFVNAVGGARLHEPAADLAIALAIAGAQRGLGPPEGTVAIAEVGLGGELRPVAHLRARLQEAARLGYQRAIVARAERLERGAVPGLELITCPTLAEALGRGADVTEGECARRIHAITLSACPEP